MRIVYMKIDLNKLFLGLKKISPALIAVFISTLLYVILPNNLLQKIGLNNLPTYVKQIIGGLLIISSALIISIIFFMITNRIKRNIAINKLNEQINELTKDELMRILMAYYSPAHVLSMSVRDGVTGALQKKHMISPASTITDGVGLLTYQFILESWVIDFLDKHIDEFGYSFEDVEKNYNDYQSKLRHWIF